MARKKKKVPEINSSSTADIAFLLLIFFLVTTSMDTDTGLPRRLPPPVPPEQKTDAEVKRRNVLVVLLNANNELLVNDEPMALSDLRAKAEEFIENPNDASDLPEKVNIEVPFFGMYPVTKNHVISLQNHRMTEYQAYIDVQNELVGAYNNLRNKLAKAKFGKSFAELGAEEQDAIKDIFPQHISEAEPKDYGNKNK